MGYDITLCDGHSGETIRLSEPHFHQGSTFAVGGTDECWLAVTFNYNEIYANPRFCPAFRGLTLYEVLHNNQAGHVIEVLERAIEQLGTQNYKADYFAPTPGNAGHALIPLVEWAKMYPDAVFQVSR